MSEKCEHRYVRPAPIDFGAITGRVRVASVCINCGAEVPDVQCTDSKTEFTPPSDEQLAEQYALHPERCCRFYVNGEEHTYVDHRVKGAFLAGRASHSATLSQLQEDLRIKQEMVLVLAKQADEQSATIARLEKENGELKREGEEWEGCSSRLFSDRNRAEDERDTLRSKLAAAREALKFYSECSYHGATGPAICFDKGDKARAALEAIGKGE